MIEAKIVSRFDALTEQLSRKAASLSKASVTSRRLARKGDPTRWRRASLVWPLFSKG